MTDLSSPCIEAGVDPLLAELQEAVEVLCFGRDHPRREHVERFIRSVFERAHGASVEAFYPHLLGFGATEGLRAVVGYRDGASQGLFAEQYLDAPADELLAGRIGHPVRREELVEVGNLALSEPGHARWVIAATTALLAAAGYRWVLFTAIRPLANAFRRLGLRPVALAEADPARLPDGGASWGRYYDASPVVYAGDILAGASKLHAGSWGRRPRLRALLDGAHRLGGRTGRAAVDSRGVCRAALSGVGR